MSETEHSEIDLAGARERYRLLSEKVALFKQELTITSDASTKFDLKKRLEKLEAERRQLEHVLIDDERKTLIQEARRIERNKAFAEAIDVWEQIRQLDPDHSNIDAEIQRLQHKQEQAKSLRKRIAALMKRGKEIGDTKKQVVQYLNQLDETSLEEDPVIVIVDQFIEEEIDAEEFMKDWEMLVTKPSSSVSTDDPNYKALADRLKRGDIALFLGSDIPNVFGDDVLQPEKLIEDLAGKAEYDDFKGSLSEIAEYYEMSDYSRSTLIHNLRSIIAGVSPAPINSFYQTLAGIEQPLILLSASYDTWLEQVFRARKKKYVLISPFIRSAQDVDIGYLHIHYSDKDEPEAPCLQEDLSGLKPIERGYSLIYKILGYFEHSDHLSDAQQNTLTLSERDYFSFARYMDKLIPDYLVAALANRGLFFLGYAPRHWEERLIVNAILNKRQQQNDLPYTVVRDASDFELKYWESNSVRRRPIDLKEFIENLTSCFKDHA